VFSALRLANSYIAQSIQSPFRDIRAGHHQPPFSEPAKTEEKGNLDAIKLQKCPRSTPEEDEM